VRRRLRRPHHVAVLLTTMTTTTTTTTTEAGKCNYLLRLKSRSLFLNCLKARSSDARSRKGTDDPLPPAPPVPPAPLVGHSATRWPCWPHEKQAPAVPLPPPPAPFVRQSAALWPKRPHE
jgi:hypothetical protein